MPQWSLSEIGLLGAYVAVLGLLCVYGVHRLELAWRAGRSGRRPKPAALADADLPSVTVQLPVMNERYVVTRLVRSVAGLDYPRDRLQIQILDDSTDDTTQIAAALADELRDAGLDVQHLHRERRTGFKAGALAVGQAEARGELVLILDADFVIRPDFLRAAVPHFADPGVGLVQARWGYLNPRVSPLTTAQATMLDGHFAVQHRARFEAGRFFNFNGTAGIFRRSAIDAAGGWQHDTLTEDLDLSYRMQLAGYRGVYLDDLVVESELPASIRALKSQQHRWAKGSLQTCRKLLPAIWRSSRPLPVKLEATFHLTENIAYLLLLLLALLSWPAVAIRESRGISELALLDLGALLAGVGSLFVFYGLATRRTQGRVHLGRVFYLMALGVGLAVNNSTAVVGGLLRIDSDFVRTPKTGGRLRTRGYRAPRDILFVLEIALGIWTGLAGIFAASAGVYAALPFLVLLSAGFLWVGTMSLREALPPRRSA